MTIAVVVGFEVIHIDHGKPQGIVASYRPGLFAGVNLLEIAAIVQSG